MKKKSHKKLLIPAAIVLLLALNSCIGISADIQMRQNGSARIVLEYRFSRMLETIGRLDGNERWLIIPVGRADFERTVSRIDGLRLVSFSSREDPPVRQGGGGDIVNRVTLDFSNTEALLKFLDSGNKDLRLRAGERGLGGGSRVSLLSENGINKLSLILNEPVSSDINPDLLVLMQQISAGYKINISFSAQGNSSMSFIDGTGNEITPPANARIVPAGNKVSLEIDTAEIFDIRQGLGLEFVW